MQYFFFTSIYIFARKKRNVNGSESNEKHMLLAEIVLLI